MKYLILYFYLIIFVCHEINSLLLLETLFIKIYDYLYLNNCYVLPWIYSYATQPAITCSKLTIETIEQGVKYVQS